MGAFLTVFLPATRRFPTAGGSPRRWGQAAATNIFDFPAQGRSLCDRASADFAPHH
jgi:hypothetical protein